jgi:hypothetical protein
MGPLATIVRLAGWVPENPTDEIEIEAQLQRPAILLVTDCWTPSWRAVTLPGSVQDRYSVLPANYTLR